MSVSQRRLDAMIAGRIPRASRKFVGAGTRNVPLVGEATLQQALAAQDWDLVNDALGYTSARLAPLSMEIGSMFTDFGALTSQSFPEMRDQIRGIRAKPEFDPASPRAVAYIRRNHEEIVSRLRTGQTNALTWVLEDGFQRGQSIAAIARRIVGKVDPNTRTRTGGLVGLNRPQQAALAKAAEELADPAQMMKFTHRAGVSGTQIAEIRRLRGERRALSPTAQRRYLESYRNAMLLRRGRTIAETELTLAANLAEEEAVLQLAQQFPGEAVYKRWRTRRDDRVRPTHRELEGVTIPVSENFDVGGYPARTPGSWDLPVHERVRCRCRLAYYAGEELEL